MSSKISSSGFPAANAVKSRAKAPKKRRLAAGGTRRDSPPSPEAYGLRSGSTRTKSSQPGPARRQKLPPPRSDFHFRNVVAGSKAIGRRTERKVDSPAK